MSRDALSPMLCLGAASVMYARSWSEVVTVVGIHEDGTLLSPHIGKRNKFFEYVVMDLL